MWKRWKTDIFLINRGIFSKIYQHFIVESALLFAIFNCGELWGKLSHYLSTFNFVETCGKLQNPLIYQHFLRFGLWIVEKCAYFCLDLWKTYVYNNTYLKTMENYEFYYKDVWERTLESIKNEEAYKIKEEDLYYFNGSRLYDCNDTLATISTQLEIGAICLNSYKEIIAAHLSKILNKDLQIYIAPEKTLLPNKSDIENYQLNIKTKDIDSEQSFANFVIGKSNSQAHVAALTVATNPGLTYNPLFIYGNSGLGKTHLLMAVANRVRESDKNKKIIYIGSGLDFVEAVAEASKNKTLNALKQSFYNADLLIVDDIQFLKGNKEKSQEIFFSIFTELVNNKKQICLAADKKPEDIEGLEERITTRFNAGLVVPILAPEYETSYQIVSKKISVLRDNNTAVDEEVISFIAANFSHDVRSLEMAINRLSFYTSFVEKIDHIDMKVAKTVLADLLKETNEDLNIGRIKKEVCNFYHITNTQICSTLRTQNVAVPRQIAMYLCRKHLNASFDSIGLEFGDRDHSTVMSSCTKIEKLVETDSLYKNAVNEIEGRMFQHNN